MTGMDDLLSRNPFSLCNAEKKKAVLPLLLELTEHHRSACPPYASILAALGYDAEVCHRLSELPFLPVGLFKRFQLSSVPEDTVRIITSSGTTGQNLSRVSVDGETAMLQRQALACITTDFLGQKRLPMLILDSPDVIRPPLNASARGVGVLGFSVCASKRVFALHEDMSLDIDGIEAFLEDVEGKPFFLFGFTFLIWNYFYRALQKLSYHPDLSAGTLIHGGGWKLMEDEAVSREIYHKALFETCGLGHIHDYYGMAEQAGSAFLECELGHLHCSNFSEIFVRRAADFSLCGIGEEGILQVLSVLPRSYPGHSLLTEDRGVLLGEDDCPCGRKGKYFTVLGRLPKAELRGCSDVYGIG